jgi:hypothetical protein
MHIKSTPILALALTKDFTPRTIQHPTVFTHQLFGGIAGQFFSGRVDV